MSGDVVALVVLLVLVVVALVAPWFGTDSRTSRAWSDEADVPYPGTRP